MNASEKAFGQLDLNEFQAIPAICTAADIFKKMLGGLPASFISVDGTTLTLP